MKTAGAVASNFVSLLCIAVGIITGAGAGLTYFGGGRTLGPYGLGGFAVSAVWLTIGFLFRRRRPRRPTDGVRPTLGE